MPKVKEPLTDKKIKAEIKKGTKTISDGSISGLALYKTKTSYIWRLRYSYGGKRSYYSIGVISYCQSQRSKGYGKKS